MILFELLEMPLPFAALTVVVALYCYAHATLWRSAWVRNLPPHRQQQVAGAIGAGIALVAVLACGAYYALFPEEWDWSLVPWLVLTILVLVGLARLEKWFSRPSD